MAAIQPFVNLQPFKGTEKENLNEFLRQLESCIQVAAVPNDDRHRYLQLHLKEGALTFSTNKKQQSEMTTIKQ